MSKGNLSDNEKEEMKALQDLRKGAGNGGAVMSDSQRLRLTALIQKSKSGEDVKGETISGQGNAPSGGSTIGQKSTSEDGASAKGVMGKSAK